MDQHLLGGEGIHLTMQGKGIFASRIADLIRRAFKLRMRGEGESNQQPCEGVTDRVNEQGAGGDVTGRDHKIKTNRA